MKLLRYCTYICCTSRIKSQIEIHNLCIYEWKSEFSNNPSLNVVVTLLFVSLILGVKARDDNCRTGETRDPLCHCPSASYRYCTCTPLPLITRNRGYPEQITVVCSLVRHLGVSRSHSLCLVAPSHLHTLYFRLLSHFSPTCRPIRLNLIIAPHTGQHPLSTCTTNSVRR